MVFNTSEAVNMVPIPESHRDLLEGPVVVSLATVSADGQPQVTPVWCDIEGGYIRINTARGRLKDRNLNRPNAKVAIMATDPNNMYRWIEIRGEVADSTEEGAREHINKLSWLYDNRDYYEGRSVPADQIRVIYRIRPTKINTDK